ncbi:MAG: putative protein N(5)-glutamine methyltransferase, partial [Nocardioides sp.]|nr:putative protein N(5)-glutamine methyltransferase [Nocardioides sp.]
LVQRRVAGEPLETVVGCVQFGPLRLSVGPGTFVPRQRSLLLASLATRAARDHDAPVVVEAFCGVAPVAATVAGAVPTAELHVSDVDPIALGHARRNLPPSAAVHLGPGLSGLPPRLRERVDVLAAVAPYVPDGEAGLLPREAREHEPARALYGGSDGLDHVRSLVDAAADWLAPSGCLLVELGRSQADGASAHARRAGRTARVHAGEDGQTVVLEVGP